MSVSPLCLQILRDIRQGLLQLGRSGGLSRVGCGDDTYMYDDEMQRLGQHWYDEPPYESDPEDFLMADTANNSRFDTVLYGKA